MQQPRYIRFSPGRIGPLGWFLGAIFAVVILAAMAFVGIVALAIGIGLVATSALLRQLRAWQSGRAGGPSTGSTSSARRDPDVIDADYRVVRQVQQPRAATRDDGLDDGHADRRADHSGGDAP